MKKILIGLGVAILIIFGGLQIAQKMIMGGESYYVQSQPMVKKAHHKIAMVQP